MRRQAGWWFVADSNVTNCILVYTIHWVFPSVDRRNPSSPPKEKIIKSSPAPMKFTLPITLMDFHKLVFEKVTSEGQARSYELGRQASDVEIVRGSLALEMLFPGQHGNVGILSSAFARARQLRLYMPASCFASTVRMSCVTITPCSFPWSTIPHRLSSCLTSTSTTLLFLRLSLVSSKLNREGRSLLPCCPNAVELSSPLIADDAFRFIE